MAPTRTMGNEPRPAGEAVPNPKENPKGIKSSCEPVGKAESPSQLRGQRRRCQASSGPSRASSRASTARGGSGAPPTRGCLFPSPPNRDGIPAERHRTTERVRMEGTTERHLLQSPCASRALPEHMARDRIQTVLEYLHAGRLRSRRGQAAPVRSPPSCIPSGMRGKAGRTLSPPHSRSRG